MDNPIATDFHYRFYNRQTKKYSSRNLTSGNLDLDIVAALALRDGDTGGIKSTFDYERVKKILMTNDLCLVKRRSPPLKSSENKPRTASAKLMLQGELLLPALIILYKKERGSRSIRKSAHFAHWILDFIKSLKTDSFKRTFPEINELLEADRKFRWWLKIIKKCRVKLL
jgi:hypothetical protein